MKKIHITVLEGLPGCGKTSRMIDEMIAHPGRYILAVPRTALVEEHVLSLRARAIKMGTRPTITSVHSDQRVVGQVQRRVADACRELADAQHAILAITHEGLQSVHLAMFDGWNVRIDETPDAVASGQLRVPVAARWLETLYDLTRIEGTKWSKVRPKPNAPSLGHFMRDDLASEELAAFHKRVLSPAGLLVDVGDWQEALDRPKAIRWWSLWTPRDLAGCASIEFAGSGYATSLCALATESFFPGEVECRSEVVESRRTGHPEVRIHYFTRSHRGSTAFWGGADGRDCLDRVGRFLGSVQGLGFWSGNKIVRDRFGLVLAGREVLPRQAGTNAYRDLTSCAFIYSNKAQTADAAILEVFGLTKDQIARARETEDMCQFVMRGAIRNPDFTGRFEIYVYDLNQAEEVRDFLLGGGIEDVTLLRIEEAGIMDFERPKAGRKPVPVDARTEAERAAERRKKDAARKARVRSAERVRKEREGTARGPGRPKKLSVTAPAAV
jgi:hypothetical protein